MKTPIADQSPEQWLRSSGLAPAAAEGVLRTYTPGTTPQVFRYSAPHLFLRFHGRGSPRPIFRPNYWADGSALAHAVGRAAQFQGFLDEAEIRGIAKTYYRELTAICHNWNPLLSDELWKIELRGSESLEGLEGPTAAQPTHAAEPRRNLPASTAMLRGGGLQVYLNPGSPFVCTPVDWSGVA